MNIRQDKFWLSLYLANFELAVVESCDFISRIGSVIEIVRIAFDLCELAKWTDQKFRIPVFVWIPREIGWKF